MMRVANHLLWAAVLAAVWLLATGEATWGNGLAGLVLGSGALLVARSDVRVLRGWPNPLCYLRLVAVFAYRSIESTLSLAVDLVLPRRIAPAVVVLPLEIEGELARFLLANLVTLTPGSLALAIDEERDLLYVLELHAADAEEVVRRIQREYERPLRGVLGG